MSGIASGGALRVLYGGTFDPVHDGHVAIARAARDALDADVALLPARDPPHKAATRADAAQRAAMLALAVDGEPRLAVDLRELGRDGPRTPWTPWPNCAPSTAPTRRWRG